MSCLLCVVMFRFVFVVFSVCCFALRLWCCACCIGVVCVVKFRCVLCCCGVCVVLLCGVCCVLLCLLCCCVVLCVLVLWRALLCVVWVCCALCCVYGCVFAMFKLVCVPVFDVHLRCGDLILYCFALDCFNYIWCVLCCCVLV